METTSALHPSPAELSPAALLNAGRYTHATCGMHPELLARLRAVAKDSGELQRLCQELAARCASRLQGSSSVAIIVAPAIGPPHCVVGAGDPLVAVWLMVDPLDIDSKQTTFCRGKQTAANMRNLYKWTGSATPQPRNELLFDTPEAEPSVDGPKRIAPEETGLE